MKSQNWLLKTDGPLIQVHLPCIFVPGTQKRRLLQKSDPLIQVTTKAGLTTFTKGNCLFYFCLMFPGQYNYFRKGSTLEERIC